MFRVEGQHFYRDRMCCYDIHYVRHYCYCCYYHLLISINSIVVLMYDICSVTKKHVRIYIYGCALHVPGPPTPPTPMVWSPTVLAATVVVLVLVLPSTSTA